MNHEDFTEKNPRPSVEKRVLLHFDEGERRTVTLPVTIQPKQGSLTLSGIPLNEDVKSVMSMSCGAGSIRVH